MVTNPSRSSTTKRDVSVLDLGGIHILRPHLHETLCYGTELILNSKNVVQNTAENDFVRTLLHGEKARQDQCISGKWIRMHTA